MQFLIKSKKTHLSNSFETNCMLCSYSNQYRAQKWQITLSKLFNIHNNKEQECPWFFLNHKIFYILTRNEISYYIIIYIFKKGKILR